MPKVSVVIPVYNSEEYLSECLDSVRAQSLKDIEVICVDDGSTDGSVDILKRFESEDRRFRVLTQDNAGAGVARNLGMSVAKGEYLSFLDSDDVFECNMLEKLVAAADALSLDVAICRCEKFDDETGAVKAVDFSIRDELLPDKSVFSADDIVERFFDAFVWWPWDKLFRRSFVEDAGLRFMALRTTNDLFFVAAALLSAKRISYLDDVLVHQRVHEGSLAKTRDRSSLDFCLALAELRAFLIDEGLYASRERDFVNFCASFSIWQISSIAPDAYMAMKRELPPILADLGVADKKKGFFFEAKTYRQVRRFINWPEACITVLVPTLNNAETVSDCVNSLLAQSLREIEVLCVDGGSEDDTLCLLHELENADSRLRVICLDRASRQRRLARGLAEAQGPYVCVVDPGTVVERRALFRFYKAARSMDRRSRKPFRERVRRKLVRLLRANTRSLRSILLVQMKDGLPISRHV